MKIEYLWNGIKKFGLKTVEIEPDLIVFGSDLLVAGLFDEGSVFAAF